MSTDTSNAQSWCVRARQILGIAKRKISSYEEAIKLEKELIAEEEKRLEKLTLEDDYEERLDRQWSISQARERIDALQYAIQREEHRRDHADEIAQKEYGLKGSGSDDDIAPEDFENLFALEEGDEDQKAEKEREDKAQFERRFEQLQQRMRPEWLKLPLAKFATRAVEKSRSQYRNQNYSGGLLTLDELENAIEMLEGEQQTSQRHSQQLSSLKSFDKETAIREIGSGSEEVQTAINRSTRPDSQIAKTYKEAVIPRLEAFNKAAKGKRPEKVASLPEFYELRGILVSFVNVFSKQYQEMNGRDKTSADEFENFSKILGAVRDELWKVNQFETLSDDKGNRKTSEKWEKAKTPDERRQLEANVLVEFGPRSPSKPGASKSYMLNGMDGKPAYVFKPMKGEKGQPGWPEGGGAPREVLFSKLNEYTKQNLGLDFGVCPTAPVTLKHDEFSEFSGRKGSVGALQETAVCTGDLADLCGRGGIERERNPNLKNDMMRISTEDVQKIAMLDFITINLDRQFDNVLVNDTGGEIRLVPIDAGNALPPRNVFDQMSSGEDPYPFGNPMSATPSNPDEGLTDGQNALAQLPQAQEKFSPDMLDKISKLDPDEIVAGMKNSEKQLPKEMRGKVDPQSYDMVHRSVRFLKAAAGELTVFEISNAYASPVDGFKDVLEAKDNDVDQVIARVILATKERVAEALSLREDEKRHSEFFTNHFDELRALGWDNNEIRRYPDLMADVLSQNLHRKDVVKEYEAAGGDEAYGLLQKNPRDFLFVKWTALIQNAGAFVKNDDNYEKLTKELGWKRQEILDNRGWAARIVKEGWKRDTIESEYEKLGGDELYVTLTGRKPKSVFLLARYDELLQARRAVTELHWDLEHLEQHPEQIEFVLAKRLDGNTIAEEYKSLGGDERLALLAQKFDAQEFLLHRRDKLKSLCQKIVDNGWGEVDDLDFALKKWGPTMVSTNVQESLRAYLQLGGDDMFERLSSKNSRDVFILERLKLLEDKALEFSREEYLEELSRAERVAREADTTVQQLLRGALSYDEAAREAAKEAVRAAVSRNQKELARLVEQIKTRVNQVERIQGLARRHADRFDQQFRELLPPEEQAKPIGMVRSRNDTKMIMEKVFADLTKFENILASLAVSQDIAQKAQTGALEEQSAYELIVTADAKRVTRFNYPPIGGADSRLSSELKALQSNLEGLQSEDDELVVRRSAGATDQAPVWSGLGSLGRLGKFQLSNGGGNRAAARKL